MASVRNRVLHKIDMGVLRQALNQRDFTKDEIDYVVQKVEG